MTFENQIRQSLRVKAARIPNNAALPPWSAPPLVAVQEPSHRVKLVPALAALVAVITVVLGLQLANRGTDTGPSDSTLAGDPYGALLTGAVVVDASAGPDDGREVPAIKVFTRRVDGGQQLVAFVEGAVPGTSSLDTLAARFTPAEPLDQLLTSRAGPNPDSNGLRIVRWTDNGRRSILAARGMSATELESLLVAVRTEGSVPTAGEQAWAPAYQGPDANPFAGGSGQGPVIAYATGGDDLRVHLDPDGGSPLDFRWFVADSTVARVDGRTVVFTTNSEGTIAAWASDGGLTTLSGPSRAVVERHVADVVIADKDQWDKAAKTATKPGSLFGTGGKGD